MRRILLVEPAYNNKYPPLGLMKLSTYHKLRGDHVEFVKGTSAKARKARWDRVYVSTLFTFYWKRTIETIRYYLACVPSPTDVFVGGVMASLMGDEVSQQLGVTVIRGLLNRPGMIDADSRYVIDHMIPDYAMLGTIDYEYGITDAYIGYATRGCPNSCAFCAVRQIEPCFVHYLPLKRQIKGIESVYGPQKDLLLLDNNILASDRFETIIHDILDLGFERGARQDGCLRRLDFNQGIDARRLTREKMKLLAKTAIHPLRMALDDLALKDRYIDRVRLAHDCGLLKHSTYVLYNYNDTPQDFYQRLRVSVELNEQLGTKISSFPMRYIPLTAKDRSYVGKYWSSRLIRGVQCILLATHGIVSTHLEFFEAAFGRTADEFVEIALMPDQYIIYRDQHRDNAASDWRALYRRLSQRQRLDFLTILANGRVSKGVPGNRTSPRIRDLLAHYVPTK
jgi:hypothetical protein